MPVRMCEGGGGGGGGLGAHRLTAYYPVCGLVHIKHPLLLTGKRKSMNLCGP